MSVKFQTPMMRQYKEIKDRHRDCVLLFRMGDFYEMFLEDAEVGAKVLDITLTARKNQQDGNIPMAGVPYHAVDNYLYKLVNAGHKVAICEQVSNPKDPGIVKREVVRIVTPGTILEDKGLHREKNNYIACLNAVKGTLCVVLLDLTTSEILFQETNKDKNWNQTCIDLLKKFSPSELITHPEIYDSERFLGEIVKSVNANTSPYHKWPNPKDSYEYLKNKLSIESLETYNIHKSPITQNTLHALFEYVEDHLKKPIQVNRAIKQITEKGRARLDSSTITNLELFESYRTRDTKQTLFSVLNKTSTAIGERTMRKELINPLYNISQIQERQSATQFFYEKYADLEQYKSLLKRTIDIERAANRVNYQSANPREIVALKHSLTNILDLKNNLINENLPNILKEKVNKISDTLRELINLIDNMLTEDPPISVREGGLIKKGVNPKLDSLRDSIENSVAYLENLEKKERVETGIQTLKVRNNKVFGFYIEVSKAQADRVPAHYQRKQTLVNAERFITPKLKEHENLVLNAEDKINEIEYETYINLLNGISNYTNALLDTSESIGFVDMFISFGETAVLYDYAKPSLNSKGFIKLIDCRHPVVERQTNITFIPNSIELDKTQNKQIAVITGPNMAGKSTFIRQIAINILMAQCGMYIPAREADILPIDGIYTRLGAADNLVEGLSTFMVEMIETAKILNDCTSKSLIIFDEVGRGTSTYDGISIAYAILQYLSENSDKQAYTLFATHYHELTSLSKEFKNIFNLQAGVKDDKEGIKFLHQIVEGSASKSYGIHVAERAGVPRSVVKRAYTILNDLEKRSGQNKAAQLLIDFETLKAKPSASKVEEELKKVNINELTPLEALNLLNRLKVEAGGK